MAEFDDGIEPTEAAETIPLLHKTRPSNVGLRHGSSRGRLRRARVHHRLGFVFELSAKTALLA